MRDKHDVYNPCNLEDTAHNKDIQKRKHQSLPDVSQLVFHGGY